MGADSTEFDRINDAIVRFLKAGWTNQVAVEIGEALGQDVAMKVREVYRQAIDCPVDWSRETMDSALAILAGFLAARFPWLTVEARARLNYCYCMTWK